MADTTCKKKFNSFQHLAQSNSSTLVENATKLAVLRSEFEFEAVFFRFIFETILCRCYRHTRLSTNGAAWTSKESSWKEKFSSVPLPTFYKDYISEGAFPNLRRHALKMCAYLSDLFSRMKHEACEIQEITDKHLENTLRIPISHIDTNIALKTPSIGHCKYCQNLAQKWFFPTHATVFAEHTA